MTLVLAIGLAGLVVLLFLSTRWSPALRHHRTVLRTIGEAQCPQCAAQIGEREAQAASDRTDRLIRKRLTATAMPGDESFWPVVCPNCSARLAYWAADRELYTAGQLVRQGWLEEYDLNDAYNDT